MLPEDLNSRSKLDNPDIGEIITYYLDPLSVDAKEEESSAKVYAYDRGFTLFGNIIRQIASQIACKIAAGNLEEALADTKRMLAGREYQTILGPVVCAEHNGRRMEGTLIQIFAFDAARRAAAGDIESVLAIVDAVPAVIHEVTKVQVPTSKKWLKGNLLSILAALNDVNFWGKEEEREDFGGVERLRNLLLDKRVLTVDEIDSRIAEALPENFQEITDARMAPYWAALEELVKDLKEVTEAQAYEAWNTLQEITEVEEQACEAWNALQNNNLDSLQNNPCVGIIHKYWETMFPDPESDTNEEVGQGLVFDPRIVAQAVDRFWGEEAKKNAWTDTHLDGWPSYKSNLFAIIGVGGLQANLSPSDLQIARKGPRNVTGTIQSPGQAPNRRVNFVAAWPIFYSSLGVFGVLNIEWGSGAEAGPMRLRPTAGCGGSALLGGDRAEPAALGKIASRKNDILATLCACGTASPSCKR